VKRRLWVHDVLTKFLIFSFYNVIEIITSIIFKLKVICLLYDLFGSSTCITNNILNEKECLTHNITFNFITPRLMVVRSSFYNPSPSILLNWKGLKTVILWLNAFPKRHEGQKLRSESAKWRADARNKFLRNLLLRGATL